MEWWWKNDEDYVNYGDDGDYEGDDCGDDDWDMVNNGCMVICQHQLSNIWVAERPNNDASLYILCMRTADLDRPAG